MTTNSEKMETHTQEVRSTKTTLHGGISKKQELPENILKHGSKKDVSLKQELPENILKHGSKEDVILKQELPQNIPKDEFPEDHVQEKALVLEEVIPDRQLVQELQKFLPHTYQIVSLLLLHLRFQHFQLMRARVFTPRCPLYRYKMAVVTNIATNQQDLESMSLFWSKDHLSDGAVCQLLRSLPGYSWQKSLLIRQLPLHLHQNMNRIVHELSQGSLEACLELVVHIFSFGNKAPDIPRLPEGYHMSPLSTTHGKKVLAGWIGRMGENQEVFSSILHRLPAVGIFKTRKSISKPEGASETTDQTETRNHVCKAQESNTSTTAEVDNIPRSTGKKNCCLADPAEPNVKLNVSSYALQTPNTEVCNLVANTSDELIDFEDELVCWSVQKHGADVGMTYTEKGHRNLGLARVATLEMVRRLLDHQLNVYVLLTDDNPISIAMHKKFGFQRFSSDIILKYDPKE